MERFSCDWQQHHLSFVIAPVPLPRILLFLTDLEFGGTPTVVRELALRLRTHADIQVACLGKWGPVAGELSVAEQQIAGVEVPPDIKVGGDMKE